jgi:hypothetical protein
LAANAAACGDPDGELPAADGVTVALLAQALCRLDDVGGYLTNHGLLDADGEVRPVVDLERRLRLEAADHADAMGMSPRSRAKLGLDLVRTDVEMARAGAERESDPERRRQLLQAAGIMVEPPDARQRSTRAAALLAQAGALPDPVEAESTDSGSRAPRRILRQVLRPSGRRGTWRRRQPASGAPALRCPTFPRQPPRRSRAHGWRAEQSSGLAE